jgi:hypothetical protein
VVRKIDDEAAFAHWIAQGEKRSQYLTAKVFKVSRRAIGKCARRNNWYQRLGDIERDAREKSDRRLSETLADTRQRHLKMLRVVAAKGLQALQERNIGSAMDGCRAIEMAIKLERVILGEPGDNNTLTIESVTRRELESLITLDDGDAEPDEE